MERKIIGRVSGPEAEQFDAHRGYLSLQDTVASFGKDHPFTALVPNLDGGIDPDEAFSRIPYEKGFYLLYWLQTLAGGAVVFESFMKAYIQHFALCTITTDEFKAFLLAYFPDNEAMHSLDWDTWLYGTGTAQSAQSTCCSLLIQLVCVFGLLPNNPAERLRFV
jgi:leukotriene-A4 hydrolase